MRENQASITALLSAFCRAYHAEHEAHPVFCDSMAKKLMTDDEYAAIGRYILSGADFFEPGKSAAPNDETLRRIVNTALAPTPLCRAAYCEAALRTAVRTGTEQYVILGAGLDTFALRNPAFAAKYGVFEVDRPVTQADKIARIRRAGLPMPEGLTFVGVDFSRDDLCEKLLAAGFDRKKKTFFSWIGVSYYLYKEEIENTLAQIAALSAEGSTLVLDYADAGLFLAEERRVQNMVAMAKAGGEEMRSSFDYMSFDTMFAAHGFLIYEFLTPADIQKQIIDPAGASLAAFEHINYATAVKKG